MIAHERDEAPIDVAKQEVEHLLKQLPRPLIIFVDDIDRLEHEQIRELFRNIKANAVLPNIIFVLMFQSDVVEAALNDVSGGNGSEYLSKIIQANFDLPPIPNTKLAGILTADLGAMISDLASEENGFDQQRWGNILVGGLRPHLGNLRDVKRYCTSVGIHLPLHRGERVLEVNLLDALAMEIFRVFDPELYERIGNSRELLQTGDRNSPEQRRKIEELLESAKGPRAAVQFLLTELFPTAAWALGGMHYGADWATGWLRLRRICTERYFERYFALRLPDGDLADSDFVHFLQSLGSKRALKASVRGIEKRGLLPALADRLDESRDHLPLDKIEDLLPVIFDIGQHFAKHEGSTFGSPFVAAWRSASWYLRQESDLKVRTNIFVRAMSATDALAVPETLLALDQSARDDPDDRLGPLFDAEGAATAKALWVTRVREQSQEMKAFAKSEALVSALCRWRDFAGLDEPRAWTNRAAADHQVLPLLVEAFVSVVWSHTFGDFVQRRSEQFQKESIFEFFDIDELASNLAKLDQRNLSDHQKKLTKLLKKTSVNGRCSHPSLLRQSPPRNRDVANSRSCGCPSPSSAPGSGAPARIR